MQDCRLSRVVLVHMMLNLVQKPHPPTPSLDPQSSEEQHTYTTHTNVHHKPLSTIVSQNSTCTLTSTHMFTTTVVTLFKDKSLWLHTTPPDLKWHSPVAYMKLLMSEILADRNFMQEMKIIISATEHICIMFVRSQAICSSITALGLLKKKR